jgi:hypothetical protein
MEVFRQQGVDAAKALYLYQYLNSHPERTDPEMFNILKFDQYKYQAAGVAFRSKWELASMINRQPQREESLRQGLALPERYCLAHLTGSSARVDLGIVKTLIDPAVRIINIDDHLTDSVFDWWGLLEGAEAIVCLDSSLANMVDQLEITGPRLYWIRRSAWDLTPVLGSQWQFVKTDLPIQEPKRVDPAVEVRARSQAQPNSGVAQGGLTSHVPFETNKTGIPTNFMHALKR